MRVLVVDDDTSIAALVDDYLRTGLGPDVGVDHASTVASAAERLADDSFDVALVDLRLPDADGIDAVTQLTQASAGVPVVVLTGTQDRSFGERVLRVGASDFLLKRELDPDRLSWSVRYAVARRQYAELREETSSAPRAQDSFAGSEATAATYGALALRDSSPTLFDGFVARYSDLLSLALDGRSYRTEHRIPQHLRDLADDLGRLRASPRDVVEVHVEALTRAVAGVPSAKKKAIIEEARVAALETMGYLAAHYRRNSFGRPVTAMSGGSEEET